MLPAAHSMKVRQNKTEEWLRDRRVNPFTASRHNMYSQFRVVKFHALLTQCMYVFCVDVKTAIISLYNIEWILGAFAKWRKTTISFRLSAWNNLAPTGRIFMKFYVLSVFQESVEKFQF
jgi:hypothetical protein